MDPLKPEDRQALQAERRELKKRYAAAFKALSELFFAHDPIGLAFGENTDEYEPEVGTVLPRLRNCGDVKDVRTVLHQEFTRWFGSETAGPEESYQALATEVWAMATTHGWHLVGHSAA